MLRPEQHALLVARPFCRSVWEYEELDHGSCCARTDTCFNALRAQARAARISAAAAGVDASELEAVEFTGVQIVVCATKFDRVRNQPLEKNEAVARALRCIAHANGAHLIYSAGAQGGRRDAEAADTQAKLRVLLAHAMFAGYDRRLCAQLLRSCLLHTIATLLFAPQPCRGA